MTHLMVKFIWMMFEFSAIAGKLIFRSWSKLQRFKITTLFLILSNVNGQSKRWIGFGYWLIVPIAVQPWQQVWCYSASALSHQPIIPNCTVIGAVTYYGDMYPHLLHILAPLTAMTSSKTQNQWTAECQHAFDYMKAFFWHMILSLHIPITISLSMLHLCQWLSAWIGYHATKQTSCLLFLQAHFSWTESYYYGERISFHCWKLKAFHTMLFGYHVLTDHHNLSFHTLFTQWVMHWCLYSEEYQTHFIISKDPQTHLQLP